MLQVPLQPVPNQQLQIVLGGQNCEIAVYQKTTGLYFDLTVNGVPIASAIIAQNQRNLVPTAYLGFTGYLIITDTQGIEDPLYTGLGSRWQMLWLTEAELASLLGVS